MDYLKAQLERLQQQLGSLNVSQKMLTATLVAIMVITMVWWGKYAGDSEMVAVLDQSFTGDDISRVTAHIQSKGIPYQVRGDKVYVPTERKFEVLADLGYAQLLPRDTKTGFDDISKQLSPFNPSNVTERIFNKNKEAALAQVIRGFPNVANATVMIDPRRERRIEGSLQPSATINITMRNGETPGKKLIGAAADVVAGAESGLARSKIAVIVDGVSYPVHDKGADGIASGDGQLDLLQSYERLYSAKVANQIAYIQGAMVSVTVELNTKSVASTARIFDPTKVAQKEKRIVSRSEETTSADDAGGEAGAAANTGAEIPSASAGRGNASSSEDSDTTFENNFSVEERTTTSPAGDARVVAASVRVPRSYFASIFTKKNPTVSDPTDAVLQPLIDVELAKIVKDVKACTGLKDDGLVTADTYFDAMPLLAASSEVAAGSVSTMVGGHVKEIGIGVLALISLFMVSMMVRKTPAPVVAPVHVEEVDPIPLAREHVAGSAGEGNALLDGMELDEETIKSQQMVDQVSTMVKENPDAAANLVKRWLNRT